MTAEEREGGTEQGSSAPFEMTETVYDPETYRLLYARGIDEGWRCLEVGGGGGSIAKWLCRRVGSTGRVVVTDLDITHLQHLDEPNLEMHRHDVLTDPMPERVFNLVHARLVMGELQTPMVAIERLVASLRTGGWLVLEDLDRTSLAADTDDAEAASLFAKVEDAVSALLTARGLDPAYGRRLYRQLRAAGLSDVIARGGSSVQAGGSPVADLLRQQLEQFRGDLIQSAAVMPAEIDGCLALLADPEFVFMSPTIVTAWGHRPSPSF
jgi:SAM-dependent methyltransferase